MMAEDTAVANMPNPSFSTASPGGILGGFYGLNIVRQLGLMVALAASVAIGFAFVLWAQGEDYRPLYGSTQNMDVSKVIQVLESNNIGFKLDHNSGALLVVDKDIHTARLKLADAGYSQQTATGFELLDTEQPLGTSAFMETARYRRSLEGELARTIMSIAAVNKARVHLAVPKSTVFLRQQRKAKASIFIELFPGAKLKESQVQAVANLVASSIPELELEDVSIVDQKGNLLSDFGDQENELMIAEKQMAYARKLEDRLNDRIHRILVPVIGQGRFKAEVSADVDFTEVEQTDEIFNPDLPAIRSEQTLNEQKVGDAGAGGVPGALANQPPADANAPEEQGEPGEGGAAGGSVNSRSQATRNYELDRTVSYTRHQVGQVRRLTVAVVIDNKAGVAGAEAEAWTADELERLAILVRDAVGFDAARGDSVNVINSAFVATTEEEIVFEELPFWQQSWMEQYLRAAAALFVGLIFIFAVLRPVLKNLSASTGATASAGGLALPDGSVAGGAGAAAGADGNLALPGGDATLQLPGPEAGYEQQLNAVRGLIAEDPARVSQVIKQWINAGE